MHIIEHIQKAKNPIFGFEIVPPPRGRSVREIVEIVERLHPLQPSWIDVTSHSSSALYRERTDGSIDKKTYRKRPGTMGICGIIQNRFRIDTVAHILCLGFTREETEDALIELHFLGVHNVLALRGDVPNFKKIVPKERSTNTHAMDLVKQISDLREGKFLDDLDQTQPLEFGVGVAGYPEKHVEAPSLKIDIQNLKKKVDAGAQYVVTQMFFDNQKYFDFVKECRLAGIEVPIIPGLKVLRSVSHLTNLPKTFHIDIPDELSGPILENPCQAAEIGRNWTLRQSQELLEAGVPYLHYYILNDSNQIFEIVHQLKKQN